MELKTLEQIKRFDGRNTNFDAWFSAIQAAMMMSGICRDLQSTENRVKADANDRLYGLIYFTLTGPMQDQVRAAFRRNEERTGQADLSWMQKKFDLVESEGVQELERKLMSFQMISGELF